MEALGINWLPSYRSEVVPNTQVVQVSVTDTNPQRAQIVANEIAGQLILQSPTIGGTETGEQQDFIKEQLANLQDQIRETETNIEELQRSKAGLTSANQIANIDSEINEQTTKLENLRGNYADFLANSQEGAVNKLSVLEPANLPVRPTGTNKITIIMLAGLVGLSMGSGAAYLLEFLDKTVKTASDIERIFGKPVIGYISRVSEDVNPAIYIAKKPYSNMAENFRMLRSNVEFFSVTDQVKTILITSPNEDNGKTTVASNLAQSLSQLELEVLLVDADLRRPAVHTALKMTKGPGLSDVVRRNEDLQNVVRPWKKVQNLKVVTSGHKVPQITEVVGSRRVSALLSLLKDDHEIIIIDSPPLIIADAYNLASTVDGVIIVMEPGQTANDQAKAIKEQLDRVGAKVLGFVFNKVSDENIPSYGDYQYQSLYSSKYYGSYNYNSKATKEPTTGSYSSGVMGFFEHGKVPTELSDDVENAITAIKTQPRRVLNRFKRSKTDEESDERTNGNASTGKKSRRRTGEKTSDNKKKDNS
jgi:capsular exopolysaccharide synthesis family protein